MIIMLQLKQIVGHKALYDGKERFEVVGIREKEVELRGDYSGGTHNVCQTSWMPIDGIIELKKNCQNKVDGNCPLHNLHCKYPDCEPLLFSPITAPTGKEGV